MTIISVDLMWSRQSSVLQSTDRKTYTIGYSSAYQVQHSVGATQDEIRNATGIPRVGDLYTGTTGVFCTTVGGVETLGPILSIVPVQWAGEVGPGGESDPPENQEPDINYYSVTTSEATDTDGYGFPLTNVNGELVEGFTKDVSDMVLDVTRNYLTVSGQLALQYLDSTNSDTYVVGSDVWLPGSAALQSYRIKPVTKNGIAQYFTVSASILFRQAYNTTPARAWWHRYRNEGLYERSGAVVALSGGGGAGAAAYAIVSSGGAITGYVVTNRGAGYTSAPTVTVTSTTGTGSGGSGTAVINSRGEVTSITLGSGGSNYKSRLVRCIDGNKEPVTKPVLLKANGTREFNAASAVWLERPKKSFSLPYSVLGLI
jgi:hypothetical protein